MFKKFFEKLKKLAEREPFDTSQFGDPIADKTDWTPLKSGGSNFCTKKLVQVSDYRFEFRISTGGILFSAIFFLAGLGVICAGFSILHKEDYETKDLIFLFAFGTLFSTIGALLYYFFSKPVVFDKQVGAFWKGRRKPENQYETDDKKETTWLTRVYAIQLISEYCSGDKSSYYSYEINLVLDDGSRVNVADHGKLSTIREDTEKLSLFLGVQVWDGIRN